MLLIINNWIHHKNKEGLEKICKYINLDFIYGSMDDLEKDVKRKFKIIYNSAVAIDIDKYDKRDGIRNWIFGPHFSVFPDSKLDLINKQQSNLFYIMPSQWCIDIWKNHFNVKINMKSITFPVDTDKFNQKYDINDKNRNIVIIYYKRRNPKELDILLELCYNNNLNVKIFDYVYGYDEKNFINNLHICKYAFILDAGESQGFAIEEMMASNIPLLVWNIRNLSQEYGENSYDPYESTSIPYWDDRCGEVFYEENELLSTYQLFIKKMEEGKYKPRDYIIENLSIEKCALRFKEFLI
jgi:hypothetical protein